MHQNLLPFCNSYFCTCLPSFNLRVLGHFCNFAYPLIYLWLCWAFVAAHRLSPAAASGDCAARRRVSHPVLLLWQSLGPRCSGSVVWCLGLVASRHGIFPDQGSNHFPLDWETGPHPPCHQVKSCLLFLNSTLQGTSGSPLQHSCLQNPTIGGASRAAVHLVAESQT